MGKGDDLLNEARELVTGEVRFMIDEEDLRTIEEKITYARDMKGELKTKSCVRKFIHTRKFYKYAKGVHEDAKFISERASDRFRFQQQPGASYKPASDDTYRIARSLYLCRLSCKDPFPPPLTQGEWVVDAWNAACFRTDAHPKLRRDDEIKYDSMKLFTDMKTRVKHAVDFAYEFRTCQAPDSIGRNASRAQALLTQTTFIYRDFDFVERPRYPYRHPIIQEVVNLTWFKNKDDIGIVFHDDFNPIPFEVIALTLTVIECRIDEWSTGTCNESVWTEERYKANYVSHLNSLRDLNTHGAHYEGEDLLSQIQRDLLSAARFHAGAPPDSTTWPGKLSLDALDAAIDDGSP